ncbi:nucleotide exchange factor GrpE [Candidatus Parabeggiatoa sp. HSG14]|uniref:nucleotide exchange factor GrpE n=1 Tax=Candidatus Parabeggiatoa sp. HSG14 TaxID=3055593 RepID=UPI0025A83CF4|nr:nucleotide exchange factor GrpE [Thiotrichales bacterium HSG14]
MINDESISSVNDKNTSSSQPNTNANAANDISDTAIISELTEQTDSTIQADSTAQNDSAIPTSDELKTIPKVEELTRQLADAKQKAENHWDSLLRKQAECDNLQKRMRRDLENARKYGLEKFSTELLEVKDSMELGLDAAAKPETNLDAVREGMTLTLKKLTDTMAKFGIMEINPIDEKFNPQWHEAMAMQPVPNVEDGIVLHIHQKGYQLNDRLLRPARVVVAKAIQAENIEKPLENKG